MGDREIKIHIESAGVSVDIYAEGVSWSPDVGADMMTRAIAGFTDLWLMLTKVERETDTT